MVQEGSGPLKGKGMLQPSHKMAARMSRWTMLLIHPAFAVDGSTVDVTCDVPQWFALSGRMPCRLCIHVLPSIDDMMPPESWRRRLFSVS